MISSNTMKEKMQVISVSRERWSPVHGVVPSTCSGQVLTHSPLSPSNPRQFERSWSGMFFALLSLIVSDCRVRISVLNNLI